ncbi:hypothetical protein PQQ32_04595 [Brachyspira hyodysenteriae]|uniref:glycosyltransferase n=1 Tax=Brachyspira hyodysenteriae TaxID=159 RepID=UPI002B2581EF|nr:glycosyltransferase [Brachyspira hyodysenteriae]WPC38748.1 hypothetical protein PQQ32_04595 [Brachyspira hyodysenteriae]
MSYHCECEQCKNKEFNPEDYIIKEEDFKVLDKERPLGISGHLRVKDEAMSVAECIDSCIDALDELIITYNKSTDNTEEILKEYEKKYPDKIRLYYYKPNIIKYNKDEYNIKYSPVHYLAEYTNFGYLKIKYKYYLKIDADQIYFTDKLVKIREALLCDINSSKTINKLLKIDKISWYIPIKKLRNNFRTFYIKKLFNIKDSSYKFNGVEELLNLKDFIVYSRIKFVENFTLEFGGFNLFLYKDNLYLNHNFMFNGCYGDTSVFIPKSQIRYYRHFIEYFAEDNIIPSNNKCISGFIWMHLGDVKRKNYENTEGLIKADDIENILWKDINIYLKDDYNNIKKDFGDKYFDTDKKYVTKEFYDRYLKKPLEYAIKNQDNFIKRLW